jgi:quercetin dioxygenase-like cupin family protein
MTTMSKKLKGRSLSLAAECALAKIHADLQRRLVLGGMLGAASLLAARPLRTFAAGADRTVVSPDGIIRTTLESYVNDAGEEFRLVLTTYPPGAGLPLHHHPSVAHNYILEGVAESQYAGEELFRFTSGQSYQDKASVQHMVFRNPDRTAPLKYLIAYTVKKGAPYLIIP